LDRQALLGKHQTESAYGDSSFQPELTCGGFYSFKYWYGPRLLTIEPVIRRLGPTVADLCDDGHHDIHTYKYTFIDDVGNIPGRIKTDAEDSDSAADLCDDWVETFVDGSRQTHPILIL
jgi:hypothetical protein